MNDLEEGECCFCGGPCNPASQACGSCARNSTMSALGWDIPVPVPRSQSIYKFEISSTEEFEMGGKVWVGDPLYLFENYPETWELLASTIIDQTHGLVTITKRGEECGEMFIWSTDFQEELVISKNGIEHKVLPICTGIACILEMETLRRMNLFPDNGVVIKYGNHQGEIWRNKVYWGNILFSYLSTIPER